jgi:hypothetical protein
MRGTVYINDAAPTGAGPEAVTLDFSATPSELADTETCYGFALDKTLEHLGLEASRAEDPVMYSRLYVEGSVEAIREHIPELQRHTGLIARYSAEKSRDLFPDYNRQWLGRLLGNLVQRQLPELHEAATLARTMGIIVNPFMEAVVPGDEGHTIYYHRYPGHGTEQNIARNADGSTINPFIGRDIGGFVIGQDGLELPQSYRFDFLLPEQDVNRARLIARVRNQPTWQLFESVLKDYCLGRPEAGGPVDLSVLAGELSEASRVRLGFATADLRTASEQGMLEQPGSLNWAFRRGLQDFLAKSEQDAELQPLLAAEQARLGELYAD